MIIVDLQKYFLVDGIKVHWDFKLLPRGFEAITLFGHVFDVRSKQDLLQYLETYGGQVMINHERIHMLQAKSFKLSYFSFYIYYLWYWFIGLFKYGVRNNASYYHIPFEREAYINETNFEYHTSNWRDYKIHFLEGKD